MVNFQLFLLFFSYDKYPEDEFVWEGKANLFQELNRNDEALEWLIFSN